MGKELHCCCHSKRTRCLELLLPTDAESNISYSTTTVTVTVDPDEPAKFKRDGSLNYRAATVKPTDVPAYASGCDSASRYSSACSCWGITATTSTAPQPTSTVTVTVTADYCEDL